MLSFVLFTFFLTIILYFVDPKKDCMLAKREKWREKNISKPNKKNVEGIQNICLSCLL